MEWIGVWQKVAFIDTVFFNNYSSSEIRVSGFHLSIFELFLHPSFRSRPDIAKVLSNDEGHGKSYDDDVSRNSLENIYISVILSCLAWLTCIEMIRWKKRNQRVDKRHVQE